VFLLLRLFACFLKLYGQSLYLEQIKSVTMTSVCPQLVMVLFQLLLQVSFVQVEAMVTTRTCV